MRVVVVAPAVSCSAQFHVVRTFPCARPLPSYSLFLLAERGRRSPQVSAPPRNSKKRGRGRCGYFRGLCLRPAPSSRVCHTSTCTEGFSEDVLTRGRLISIFLCLFVWAAPLALVFARCPAAFFPGPARPTVHRVNTILEDKATIDTAPATHN